jgi:hypothetical protein
MTTAALEPGSRLLGEVVERASDPELWQRFQRQLRSIGYCRRPVRLCGEIDAVDVASGEVRTTFSTAGEPDETLLKCCGNRREAVCPTCAETYRRDAFQLVAAGLRGGKGVPETVVEHPVVFATLTAPSFGPVHSRRLDPSGQARRCRARRDARVCPHGVRMSCGDVHADDDPRLGEPICPDCFDYQAAVMWNALAPELWRRTAIRIPRELARLTGVSQKRLRERVRVSYVKVAEYQARGALHFHCVVRLDAAPPKDRRELAQPPPSGFTAELLADAIRRAAAHTTAPVPQPPDDERRSGQQEFALEAGPRWPRMIRWGAQVDGRVLAPGEAASCAGYIAKYATKSTEVVGGLVYRLSASDIEHLDVRPHVARMVCCAWTLATRPHLHRLRLRRCAHALGFRGHCFTKSHYYSTTFTRLRRARYEHQLRRAHGAERRDPWGRRMSDGACVERGRWAYTGIGYRMLGDAWLAESGRARVLEQRRVAREELRAGRGVGGESRGEGRRR